MSLRTTQLLPLLACAILASPLTAQQTTPDSVVRLPDVIRTVVRNHASPWRLSGALSSREVSDAQRGSARIEDALAGIPGLLVQSRSGGVDLRLTIRGFGSRGAGDRSNAGTIRGIRVLVDGFPETEPDGRTSMDLVDLGLISTVDVLRSNGSASWGNAAGGVIAFSTVPQRWQSPASVILSAGAFGFRRAVSSAHTQLGNSRLYGTLTRTVSDGWRANSSGERTVANVGWLSPENAATTGGVFVTASRNQFAIPGPLTAEQATKDPQQANATYLARHERRDNTVARIGARITHQFTGGLGVTASTFFTDKHLERSERGTYRFFDRTHRGASLLAEQDFGAAGRTIAGVDLAMQDGPARFWSLTAAGEQGGVLQQDKNEWARNLGVFVAHDVPISSRLGVSLGARWDAIDYRYFDVIRPQLNDAKRFQRVTPKIGLSLQVAPTHLVYANLGGGIEAPAGNETDPPGTFGQDTIHGLSPLLEPIRSTSYEVGVRRYFAATSQTIQLLRYDLALYQTDVHNEIVPYRGGRFYLTAGEARRRGLEASATMRMGGGIDVSGSLTLQDHKYVDYVVDSVHYGRPGQVADYSGNRVVGSPRTFATGDIRWDPTFAGGVRLSAGIQGVGAYFVNDANTVEVDRTTLVSAGLGMRTAVEIGGGLGVRGSLSVNNLLNSQHAGSAFLNPDIVAGTPVAYEPGMPRHLLMSFTIDRMERRD